MSWNQEERELEAKQDGRGEAQRHFHPLIGKETELSLGCQGSQEQSRAKGSPGSFWLGIDQPSLQTSLVSVHSCIVWLAARLPSLSSWEIQGKPGRGGFVTEDGQVGICRDHRVKPGLKKCLLLNEVPTSKKNVWVFCWLVGYFIIFKSCYYFFKIWVGSTPSVGLELRSLRVKAASSTGWAHQGSLFHFLLFLRVSSPPHKQLKLDYRTRGPKPDGSGSRQISCSTIPWRRKAFPMLFPCCSWCSWELDPLTVPGWLL